MFKTKLVSSQEKVFIDDDISKFEDLTHFSVLKGERFSVQLLYVDEGTDYTFDRRPLIDLSLSGSLAEYATVRDVRNVPVDRPINPEHHDDQYLRKTAGIYPDLLTPLRYGGKVVVGRDKLRSLWIEIEPSSTLSGEQSLTLTLSLDDFTVSQSFTVNIIPAKLSEHAPMFTQWFYCDCLAAYYNVPAWSEKHWEIVENFARVYAKRGRNMIYTPLLTPALNVLPPFERVPSQLVDVTVNNGEYSFGFDKVDRWIDMCDRLGIEYFEISHFFDQHRAAHSAKVYATVDGVEKQIFTWDTLSDDEEYVRFLREMVGAFVKHMKARGDDGRCYYHISDEPYLDYIDHYTKLKHSIEDIVSDYTIMDALSDFDFYSTGVIDTPVPVTSKIMPFIEAGVKNLWTYYACNQLVEYTNCYVAMPSWRTRSLGMQLFKYNIFGFLHWGYNYYNNRASGDTINPYLDLGGEDWVPAGDTFIVYPAQDGTALESIRAITMDEAMQDIRAMRTAEALTSHEKVVEVMEKALGDTITFERCTHSADEMLRVREAINKLIIDNISK
jgi:hypothetical protein